MHKLDISAKQSAASLKIDKITATLQGKIEKLSGNYQTNTVKRQREQRERDRQREMHIIHKDMLEYIGEEVLCRSLTAFEDALLVNTFYDDMLGYQRRREHKREHPDHRISPETLPTYDSGAMKRLEKAGVTSDANLIHAIDAFEDLMKNATVVPDPKAAQMRDIEFRARLYQAGDIQFTPDEVAVELIRLSDIGPGDLVLEPEAGIARIADKAKMAGAIVHCCETVASFREYLQLKGYELIGDDFLKCKPNPVYKAAIMNPPFSAECAHICHAYDFVQPGGVLTAVCCNRVQWKDSKEYTAFREWLDTKTHSFHDNPVKFEMTGTATIILVIEK